MRRLLAAVCAAAVVIGAGAAGGATSPAPRYARDAADHRASAAALLRLPDLPAGWARKAATRQASAADLRLACDDSTPNLSALTVTGVRDVTFWVPGKHQVSHLVALLATRAQAEALFRDDYERAFPACLQASERAGAIRRLTRIDFALPGVDVVGYRTVADVSGAVGYADSVFLRRGRAVELLLFSSLRRPFAADLERRLVARAAARLPSR